MLQRGVDLHDAGDDDMGRRADLLSTAADQR
jgi:hypothetical protein